LSYAIQYRTISPKSGPKPAKPSRDHIPLGGFVRHWTFLRLKQKPVSMRQAWMRVNYLIAIAIATIGWLCFIGWVVRKVF